jgi:beta-N-acetylhexosaminidase
MSDKEHFLKDLIDRMTLDQKVGACLTLGFNGTILTPNILEYVTKYHCGSLRVTPPERTFGNYVDPKTGKSAIEIKGDEFFYKQGGTPPEMTGAEYVEVVKEIRAAAKSRPLSLPLHFSFDNEGEGNVSFKGFSMFPQPMGLCATGEKRIAYEVAKAIGRQARSVGMTMIHSPVLDVNSDPRNPEINIRAYSDKAEVVAEYSVETCRGFKEAGIATTGKHFPGRGDSAADAHYDVPVIDVDFDTLWNRELLPYRVLIEQNLLPALMLAHTIYPAVDPDRIGTLSRKMITELIREKLGFEGVVTTDSMTMAGVASQYGVAEACALSLAAGSDQVLMKAQNDLVDQTFRTVKAFVEDGRIPADELNQKLMRILGLKYDLGLFDDQIDRETPDELVSDPAIKALEKEVAEKSCIILKTDPGVLPLKPDQRFLLVEQITTERNNCHQHPAMMFKHALRYNQKLAFCEIGFSADEEDLGRMNALIPDYDTIVLTNFQDRASAAHTEFLQEQIAKHPQKIFIIVINKPFAFTIPDNARNVICTFSKAPQSLKAAVEILFGKLEQTGELPIATTL